jgi:endonuclease/exonuclease/phosphatase family metal-dependent hydrolase
MDLDVLAVQEVEDVDTLAQFARQDLEGLGYRHVVLVEGNDPRLIDVGLLSRLPLGGVTSWRHAVHPEAPGQPVFSRDLLEVEVLNERRTKRLFTIYNTHLKSHFVPFGQDPMAGAEAADERRRQQAESLARIVSARMLPNSSFLVVGDMNDAPDAAPLAPLLSKLPLTDGLADAVEDRPAPEDTPPAPLFDHVWLSDSAMLSTSNTRRTDEDLLRVLNELRLPGMQARRSGGGLTMILPYGAVVRLATVAARSTSPSAVQALVEAREESDKVTVVVADRVSAQLRERLREQGVGWLDRRGHLRLVHGGLVIDTDVPSLLPPSPAGALLPRDPCATPVGRDGGSGAARGARTDAHGPRPGEGLGTGAQLDLLGASCSPGPRTGRRPAPSVQPGPVLGSCRRVAAPPLLAAQMPRPHRPRR